MKKHNKQYQGKPEGDRRVCSVKGFGQLDVVVCDCKVEDRCRFKSGNSRFKFRGFVEPLKK